jgi:hypothetical protein
MAHLRRLLAYSVCVAIATPPLAYGQTTPPSATTSVPNAQLGLAGVELSASQSQTYARLKIKWPVGAAFEANGALNSGLVLIRLPRPLDVDPSVFTRSAPQFVAGAALSADKRTIRVALVQGARLVQGRSGDTQAFDLVQLDAPNPPAFGTMPEPRTVASAEQTTPVSDEPLAKMINGAAPVGAPRVQVQASVSKEFTRLRLTNATAGSSLPDHGYARRGDRVAIAMPGQYALDIASLRSQPPARILDAARHSSDSNTALVMDLAPGSAVRHAREGSAIVIDILPPGTNPNSIEALQAQAVASVGVPSPADQVPKPLPAQAAVVPPSAQMTASALASEQQATQRSDPAPSGRVLVTAGTQGTDVVLSFGFESPAPAVVFRRGDSIYALFSTTADFDISKFKPSSSISAITPIKGEGVSGVRIVAPPQVAANPTALAGQWRLTFTPTRAPSTRAIGIERETAADGTGRVKALVPDGAAIGSIVDPVVGDTILLGLALGPASPLVTKRSFLEASLPETYHGLAVTPRTEDFELRRAADGFVLVRPNGMALSGADVMAQSAGFTSNAPGYVDYKTWQLGPKTDFLNNLNRLRREAAFENGDPTAGVRKRLDLARFLIAWDLGAEAAGVLRQLKTDVITMARSPELMALEGISNVLMGHGKEALDVLSEPEVADDPASQLWAGLAAQMDGNAEEARVRFGRGMPALANFAPQQRAAFLLAQAGAVLDLGEGALAVALAGRARDDAQDEPTKLRAQLMVSRALAKAGRSEEALAGLTLLEGNPDREVATRATYEKAIIGFDTGKTGLADTIRALDSLRYAWRGDELELEVLRRLGGLYITGGDIRSGLTTMASATSLRPDLPGARKLRDELYKQFTYLFLEGGADGMDPIQALALFYDFKDLAPIGPDGDRMVRGLGDRLVALDLLPQATALLQHQVDKRLEGFAKAQVATDLAAIYLMDRRPEPALQAIWNSRVTMLPEALNAQRRMIEAAALAELGRTEHAIELIEFDASPDASRLRTELYMRANDWPKAVASARATLPLVKANFEPEEAGEVLRTAVATSMARDPAGLNDLVDRYGAVMGKSAFAEAFKVVTNPGVPDPAALQAAVATLTGGSPYNGLMKRLRSRLTQIEAPSSNTPALVALVPTDPTDGDKAGAPVTAPVVAPLLPEVRPNADPAKARLPAVARRVAQSTNVKKKADAAAVVPSKTTSRNVEAPRDPPPAPITAR